MNERLDIMKEFEFYIKHLKEVILPFWLRKGVDKEYGGFFTCFENSGNRLLSEDKYTWSQGRMVWIFSKLSRMEIFAHEERKDFLSTAKNSAGFLMENCMTEDGSCAFILDKEGKKKYPEGYKIYDISNFADCFVILGLSMYAKTSGDLDALRFAQKLYEIVVKRYKDNEFKAEPTPVPPEHRMHGVTMILLNTSSELSQAMKALSYGEYELIQEDMDKYRKDILDNFVDDNNILHEYIKTDSGIYFDTILGRVINPGHILEDAWFMLENLDAPKSNRTVIKISDIVRKTIETGWDRLYGGFFQFADYTGNKPQGAVLGLDKHITVQKILSDWSNKLWWPHSESLYTTLLLYYLTGDDDFLEYYKMIYDYTFSTFPNPDRKTGEWIQIRDRHGSPVEKVVALPVKDPYHIMRNLILIIELLQNHISN